VYFVFNIMFNLEDYNISCLLRLLSYMGNVPLYENYTRKTSRSEKPLQSCLLNGIFM
jgi:hypothetical protein